MCGYDYVHVTEINWFMDFTENLYTYFLQYEGELCISYFNLQYLESCVNFHSVNWNQEFKCLKKLYSENLLQNVFRKRL